MGKSFRQRADEIEQVHLFGGLHHFFLADRFGSQADVFFQRSGEQIGILQHHAELAAQFHRIELAQVAPADADRALLDVVEAQQQADERGFSRAGVSHHGDGFAGRDGEAHVAQHPILIVVCEPDAVEFDGGDRAGRFGRRGRREHRGGRIEQLENALARCHGGLQNVVLFAEILYRAEEAQAVLQEGRHHAESQSAGLHAEAAVAENGGHGDHRKELDHGIEPSVRDYRRLVGMHVFAIHRVEFHRAAALAVEELKHRDTRDVFLQVGVDARDGDADAAVTLAHAAAEDGGRKNYERHGEHHDQREHGAEAEHDEDDEGERQHVADDGDQAGSEQVVEHVDIGGDAGDETAHRVAVVECEIEGLQVFHQLLAQIEHGKLAGVLHDIGLREFGDEVAGQHAKVEQRDARQAIRRARGEPGVEESGLAGGLEILIHRDLREQRSQALQHRLRRQKRERNRDQRPVGPHVSQQPPHQPAVVCFGSGTFLPLKPV